MADDAIVFAMANPTPEIAPEDLPPGKVAVVATGRSDYPNQINNVLAFPGVFRGALDVRASDDHRGDEGRRRPRDRVGDRRTTSSGRSTSSRASSTATSTPAVAAAVAEAAERDGVARRSAPLSAELAVEPCRASLTPLLVVQRLERVELRGAARREDRGDDPDERSPRSRTRSPASSGTRSRSSRSWRSAGRRG